MRIVLYAKINCFTNIVLLSIVVENLAVLSMWGGDWYDFYIVEKDNESLEETTTV
jgi:hypothetical protein